MQAKLSEILTKAQLHTNCLLRELPDSALDKKLLLETVELAVSLQNLLLDLDIPLKIEFPTWFASNTPSSMYAQIHGDHSCLQDQIIATKMALCCRLKAIGKASSRAQASIEEICLRKSRIVFCTVSTAGRRALKEAAPFDFLIVDEAAQLVEAEASIVLQMPGLSHAVLVGDHQQLRATVISQVATQNAYGRSLFERLQSLGHPSHLLSTQYRMHPEISAFPNCQFYNGSIADGENVRGAQYTKIYQTGLYGPFAFIDVKEGLEEEDVDGLSKRNSVEAAVVIFIIKKLLKLAVANDIQNLSVGVITPYASQVNLLQKHLETQKIHQHLNVDVNSVDGFQGQERDIILLSTVRANAKGNIGFVADQRRMNVAITRARYNLYVVGSATTLSLHNDTWRTFVSNAKSRKLCIYAGEDNQIKKEIQKIRVEMNQLSDLLHMDSFLFTNMVWKVLFSNEFKMSITKIKSADARQRVISRVVNLSSGLCTVWFKRFKAPGEDNMVDLIQTHPIGNAYLVWTVDVDRHGNAVQIIKIWDVVDKSHLPNLMQRLQNLFGLYSQIYIDRCKARRLSRDKQRYIPETWEVDAGPVWFKSVKKTRNQDGLKVIDCESCDTITLEKATVNESLLLMKFYCLSSNIARHLLTAKDGSEVNLPFELNDEESSIIQHQGSSFILGRSGTGKTTVLVTKILQRQQQFILSVRGIEDPTLLNSNFVKDVKETTTGDYLRQILVTTSPVLCAAIKNHLAKIQRSTLEADQIMADATPKSRIEFILDADDENKMMGSIPESFENMSEMFFPMIITMHKFLLMLDNSVYVPFFSVKKSHCTLNPQLCESRDLGSSHFVSTMYREKEVDFELFDALYWPKMDSRLSKQFDSSAVFTEIMSEIKGSIQAVQSPKGVLSEDAYVRRAETRQSVFNAEQREAVYSLFLKYEKLKMERNEYDVADHVIHLYKQLNARMYKAKRFHYVYIDEVQDLTQAQIVLFSFVGANVREGFCFAGDTAQTIARGVRFRFEDLKSLFYTEFLKQESCDLPCSTSSAVSMGSIKNKNHVPRNAEKTYPLHQLTHNFRTHLGVVNIARSIVELICHFFPHSIDKLAPETSLISGERPTFLTANGHEFVKKVFGCNGDDVQKGDYEFGAQQAILVRDENQKRKIGKKSLVLDVIGCKGLEFQDVLLYNFFTDSPLAQEWRVVYHYMSLNVTSNAKTQKHSHPEFDENRHRLLCSELKHLYVAVTRARQRLWIYEEEPEYCKPILDYWLKSELVQVKTLDESLISSMQVISSKEDWRETGIRLMNSHQYDMAILSFEKAGDVFNVQLAKAARLLQTGERELERDKQAAQTCLREAANMFLSLEAAGKAATELADKAAKCFIKCGDFLEAGQIYYKNCRPPKFESAGDYFCEGKDWMRAADAYLQGKCFKKCLDACLKGNDLEIGLSFIEQWQKGDSHSKSCKPSNMKASNVDTVNGDNLEEAKDDYLRKCATFYLQQKNIPQMLKFVKMSSNIFLKREFLKSNGYIKELVAIEESEGYFLEAAELAEVTGDFIHAAALLEKISDKCCAIKKILSLINRDIFWGKGKKGWPNKASSYSLVLIQKVENMIAMAKAADLCADMCHDWELEIRMLNGNQDDLDELRSIIETARQRKKTRIEIITSRRALDVYMKVGDDMQKRAFRLDEFVTWCQQIVNLWLELEKKILSLTEALQRLYKRSTTGEDGQFLECAYHYFGVTQAENVGHCVVPDMEAYWIRNCKSGLSRMEGKKAQLTQGNFARRAADFWQEELKCIKEQILKSLKGRMQTCCDFFKTSEFNARIENVKFLLDLVEISDKVASEFAKDLRLQVIALVFPQARSAQHMFRVMELRQEPKVVAILENAAGQMAENQTRGLTHEERGKLQMIIPFLRRNWKESPVGRSMLEIIRDPERESCILDYVLKFGYDLVVVYALDWRQVKGYVSPLVFVALLEKATVMAVACTTFLHGMLLPLTLAADFMSGDQGQAIMQRIMVSQQQSEGRENLLAFLHKAGSMAFELLRNVQETEIWMQSAGCGDLPSLALRLVVLLLVCCLNSRLCPTVQNYTFKWLQNTLESNFRVLKALPESFIREVKGGIGKQRGRRGYSRAVMGKAFARGMGEVRDGVVMTKRCWQGCCEGFEAEGMVKVVEVQKDARNLKDLLLCPNDAAAGDEEGAAADDDDDVSSSCAQGAVAAAKLYETAKQEEANDRNFNNDSAEKEKQEEANDCTFNNNSADLACPNTAAAAAAEEEEEEEGGARQEAADDDEEDASSSTSAVANSDVVQANINNSSFKQNKKKKKNHQNPPPRNKKSGKQNPRTNKHKK